MYNLSHHQPVRPTLLTTNYKQCARTILLQTLTLVSNNPGSQVKKNNRIYSIVPDFKYIKDEEEITTIEYITVYGQYKLKVKFDNKKVYEFIIVSYIETLQ